MFKFEKVKKEKIEVKINNLNEEDIEHLEPILREHVRDRDTGEILENEIEKYKRYMLGEKDDDGRKRIYLVAKGEDGEVLGCMAYALRSDKMMEEHFKKQGVDAKDCAELLNAFVSGRGTFPGNL